MHVQKVRQWVAFDKLWTDWASTEPLSLSADAPAAADAHNKHRGHDERKLRVGMQTMSCSSGIQQCVKLSCGMNFVLVTLSFSL